MLRGQGKRGGNTFLVQFGVWPEMKFKLRQPRPLQNAWGKGLLWKAEEGMGGSLRSVCFCAGPGPCLLGKAVQGANSPWEQRICDKGEN